MFSNQIKFICHKNKVHNITVHEGLLIVTGEVEKGHWCVLEHCFSVSGFVLLERCYFHAVQPGTEVGWVLHPISWGFVGLLSGPFGYTYSGDWFNTWVSLWKTTGTEGKVCLVINCCVNRYLDTILFCTYCILLCIIVRSFLIIVALFHYHVFYFHTH